MKPFREIECWIAVSAGGGFLWDTFTTLGSFECEHRLKEITHDEISRAIWNVKHLSMTLTEVRIEEGVK